jgi:protein SCO1/2
VAALAEVVGFRYRWFEERKDFAHGAGMFVLTPEGKISRTLYGISFPERDLKLALTEASEGRLGSPFDRLLLYCFSYDPETHKYALVAKQVMKLGGALTVASLGITLILLWRRDRRRHRLAAA